MPTPNKSSPPAGDSALSLASAAFPTEPTDNGSDPPRPPPSNTIPGKTSQDS